MIKRLKSRKSRGTLVANPRRKKRGSKRRSLSAFAANPHKRRNGSKLSGLLKRRRSGSKKRNGDMTVGGLDLVTVGIGSIAAIALSAVGQGVFDKYLSDKVSSEPLAKAAPSLMVAGAAWAAQKYVKNPKVKSIAKVTLALAIFKAIDDSVGKTITESVEKALPGMSGGLAGGAYIPALRGNFSGAHIDATGGAWTHTAGILPGANLYGL
jgi:hypothetical protein